MLLEGKLDEFNKGVNCKKNDGVLIKIINKTAIYSLIFIKAISFQLNKTNSYFTCHTLLYVGEKRELKLN